MAPECDFARNNGPRLGGPPRPYPPVVSTPSKPHSSTPPPATAGDAAFQEGGQAAAPEATEALQLLKQQQELPLMDAFAGGFVAGCKGVKGLAKAVAKLLCQAGPVHCAIFVIRLQTRCAQIPVHMQ